MGILVTVTLLALLGVDADVDGMDAIAREAAVVEPVLGVAGRAAMPEPPRGDGEDEAAGAGDEMPAAAGRYFLLERSTEPDDCQERLCESVGPDAAERSGLEGEAYF